MAEPYRHRFRVRIGECDNQSVVFNANYMGYIDETLTALCRDCFGSYMGGLVAKGVDLVVAETTLRFIRGARAEELIDSEMTITHLGTTSMLTFHRLATAEGELVLEADMRYVWITSHTMSKTPIPDWVRAGLAPHFIPAAPAG